MPIFAVFANATSRSTNSSWIERCNEQTRSGDAGLSGGGEDPGYRTLHRVVDVRVREDNVGRLSAKLQAHPLDVPGRGRVQVGPGAVRAGERDLPNQGMLDERLSRLRTEPGHHVHHTFRKSCLLDELDELQSRGGGVLGRLEDHRVAGREGRSELPRDEHQRRVPRNDSDADPERLVSGEGECRLVGADDGAFDLVRKPGVVVIDARDVAKLRSHLAQQLSVVAHLQLAEALGVLVHEIREAAHERPAPRRMHPAPFRRLERTLGGLHRAVRILRVAARHERPRPGGVGVVALEILSRRRLDGRAVDVHVQLLEGLGYGHRACHCVRSPVSGCRKGTSASPTRLVDLVSVPNIQ